ncbi:MAG: DUF2934 domain-containing protein [Acetobacteraceae bacterium]|nr:DUF2934 domain-containing protein [Acetobacteraceae bacterium]MBV8521752.1 DUF2934 domain-containing protein [Acetobacteraceae bacterium]MBV8589512.1 DUF2934 domain-containing protein [Acetobacteraceae bacterium]
MSDNPLVMSPEREQRIRERAYHLWEQEGRPEGRETEFWERAEYLIGMEENAGAAQLPNPVSQHDPVPGVVVEEAQIQENYGEFPDRLTDQGEWRQTPMTRAELREYEEGKMQPTRGDYP